MGVALVLIRFCRRDFPLVTIQLLGYPHDWWVQAPLTRLRICDLAAHGWWFFKRRWTSGCFKIRGFQYILQSSKIFQVWCFSLELPLKSYNIFQTSMENSWTTHASTSCCLEDRLSSCKVSTWTHGTLTPQFTTGSLFLFGFSGVKRYLPSGKVRELENHHV